LLATVYVVTTLFEGEEAQTMLSQQTAIGFESAVCWGTGAEL
jgi:hypothetical protein